MPLEHLFDAELEYRPAMVPLADHGDGELIGSGEGTVDGQRLRGAMRWTLFEGGGDLVCTMHPMLTIHTEDRVSIRIEGRSSPVRAPASGVLTLCPLRATHKIAARFKASYRTAVNMRKPPLVRSRSRPTGRSRPRHADERSRNWRGTP